MRGSITMRRLPALAAVLVTIAMSAIVSQSFAQNVFELNEQTFNQWLYNSNQGRFDSESELSLTVEAVDRVCDLSDSQKEKLRLAGHGDYARFSRQVADLRSEYVGKTYSQDQIGNIYQKIQPLSQVYQAGLLGDESLFEKVLGNTLTLEQAAKFDRIKAQRRRVRYNARIGLFIVTLERSCPLTDIQRKALAKLLVDETKPPKRFGQYDWYLVMYQASQVPDDKYKQFLDDAQLRQLRRVVAQGAGMEHFLRQQKILDE